MARSIKSLGMDNLVTSKHEVNFDTKGQSNKDTQSGDTKVMSPSTTLGEEAAKATKREDISRNLKKPKKSRQSIREDPKGSRGVDKEDVRSSEDAKTSKDAKISEEAKISEDAKTLEEVDISVCSKEEVVEIPRTKTSQRVTVKVMRLKDMPKVRGQRMGVLDSGATHPVRPKRKEDKIVRTLKVELAGSKEIVMEVNENEVLMGAEGSQVIVPMLAIIKELDCQISTSKDGILEVVHPRLGKIIICQKSGSPLIPKKHVWS